jgi:hypothetical protein
MVRERFGADWVSIFPSKWRAKELLRISQPHDYIYIILYLYIHHKGSHSGMHDHTTFIPCFDHGIGELPENPMVVPSLSYWNCIWGNHPISDQILLKRLVHKFMIHHDQGAGGSFLFVSDGVRWCTPPGAMAPGCWGTWVTMRFIPCSTSSAKGAWQCLVDRVFSLTLGFKDRILLNNGNCRGVCCPNLMPYSSFRFKTATCSRVRFQHSHEDSFEVWLLNLLIRP